MKIYDKSKAMFIVSQWINNKNCSLFGSLDVMFEYKKITFYSENDKEYPILIVEFDDEVEGREKINFIFKSHPEGYCFSIYGQKELDYLNKFMNELEQCWE